MTGSEVERRIVTVLFCDLVGFTALSERLDAEDVSIVQQAYFSAVRDAVGRYGGKLEKFIGDAAVAVFGTPAARDDDAERGVRCAFAIAGAIEQVCARLGLEEGVLQVRVGVNTGEAVVHPNPAPGEAIVTGDTVNTAARLQSAAPPGGVMVGPTTALAVAEAIELAPAEPVELKGKGQPVRASLALTPRPERSRDHAMGALRAPMLGRGNELDRLSRALESIRAGGAARITVVAPPGVGKTRLVSEFAVSAVNDGAAVRRARLRPDVLAPYGAVSELLASALAGVAPGTASDAGSAREVFRAALVDAGVPPARAEVVTDEALAVVWPPDVPGSGADTAERRDALFASWRQALGCLGGGPELWIVEDVHWGGGDVLAFLDGSGVGETGRGRLVVATARPSLLDTAAAWARGADLLDLPPLGGADTCELIRALVGEALPDELVREAAERSDGNALFIEELLRTWVSTGILEAADAGWRLATPAREVPLPETVQAIYAAQLDDLPLAARSVARTASVAGRRFPGAALEPLGVRQADDGLEVLARRALVGGPTLDPVVGETFSFRHALLRDAGYASLARVERARLHVRMARWLEGAAGRHSGQVAGVIGRHYAAAVDAAPTLSADVGDGTARDEATSLASLWFERGAEAAMALAAHDAAAALLRRALELTVDDDVLARARRLAGLARATAFVSDMDEGTRLARDALALLREVVAGGRATAEVRVAYAATTWLLCRILAQQLRFHEVVELAERGLADIGEADDVPTGRLVVARGLGRSMIGDEELASNERGSLERVLAIARSAADRDLELDARMWLSLEDGDESHWRRIAEVAGELGRLDAAAQALQVLTALTLPDDAASGLTRLQEQRTFGVAHGLTEEMAWADYRESELRFHLGGWDEAFAAATRAIEVGTQHAFHRVTVRSWHVATMIADGRGDADTLTRAADWYRARRVELPDSPYGRLSLKQVELIFARNGIVELDPPDLEHLAASLIEEHVLPSWFAGVDLVVFSWIDRGDLEAARSAVSAFVGAGRPSRGVFGGAVADLLRARISNARAEAERAAEAFRALGTPWWLAKALRLLDRADRATAAERREAEAIERRLGLVAPAR